MRTLRTASILCLGLILGAIAAYYYFLWQRGPQPVTRIDTFLQQARPLVRPGQLMKWEGDPNGTAFSIVWVNGPSPCDSNSDMSSHLVKTVPTVTCRVMKNLPAGAAFGYVIKTGGHDDGKVGGGTNPCYGCTSYTDSGEADAVKLPLASGTIVLRAADAQPGVAVVSCTNSAVAVTPEPAQSVAVDTAAALEWHHAADVTLPTAPVISNQQGPITQGVTCNSVNGYWACTFPATQGLTYQIAATGTSGTNCGTNPGSGSIAVPSR